MDADHTPRVSVVMPTRDRHPLLERAVASVVGQTMADLELLVVDDGSTDDTALWLGSEVRDPRLRSWSISAGGVSAARNHAIAAATGTWVAFLDDDNEWLPTYLSAQLATAAASPAAGVVYSRARCRHDDGHEEVRPATTHRGRVFDALLGPWFPKLSACIVRRDLLEAVGAFRRDLEVLEDQDLMLRLARATEFAATDEPLLIRHEHLGPRLSADPLRAVRAIEQLDREWRTTILEVSGRAGYLRWSRYRVADPHLRVLVSTLERDGRRAATRAAAGLARHLPWTLPAMGRPALALLLGSRGYASVRSRRRRLGSLARDRRRAPPPPP